MREILFKAKLLNGEGWVYGMPSCDMKYIFYPGPMDSPDNYEVNPKTVCQYTGLKDKNGNKIFEGDIVNESGKYGWKNCVVKYGEFSDSDDMGIDTIGYPRFDQTAEIIGNIHD